MLLISENLIDFVFQPGSPQKMSRNIDIKALKDEFLHTLKELQKQHSAKPNRVPTMDMVYKRATDALKEYNDEDIESLYDLKKVTGIGQTIINALIKYYSAEKLLSTVENGKTKDDVKKSAKVLAKGKKRAKSSEDDSTTRKKRKIQNKKPYVPKVRSGAYAILLSLLENLFLLENSMIKDEIIEFGVLYCDTSFKVNPSTNDFFTAWSTMKQLINKELVEEINGKRRPQRYGLTTAGMVLAATLKKIHSIQFARDGLANEYIWRKQWNRYYKNKMMEETLEVNDALMFDQNDDVNSNDSDLANTEHTDNITETSGVNDLKHTHKDLDFVGLLENEKLQRNELFEISHTSHSINRSVNQSALVEDKQEKARIPHLEKELGENSKTSGLLPSFLVENDTGKKVSFMQTPFEIWGYNAYEIVLLIDTREIRSLQDRDFFTSELRKKGIKVETRQLAIGDFLWIARHSKTAKEVFLNCIIERKRIDDLCSSIKDKRFNEQKQRLKKTGYKWCFYIVEESLLNNRLLNMMEAIKTSFFEVTQEAGFILQRTKGSSETVTFLTILHQLLSQRLILSKKGILVIKANEFKDQQEFTEVLMLFRKEFEKPIYSITENSNGINKTEPAVIYECCHTFTNFQAVMGKSIFINANQLYLKALLSVKGCSLEKALSIQTCYPTFKQLLQGYNTCNSKADSEMLLFNKFDLYPTHKKIGKTLSEKLHEAFGKNKF